MRKVRLRLGLGLLISAAMIAMLLSAAQAGESRVSIQTGIEVKANDQKSPLGEETLGNMNRITDSLGDNVGVLSVNQASGNLNNQANVRVFSLDGDPCSRQTFEMGKTITLEPTGICSGGGARQNVIEGSLRNNVSITGINQSAGSLNSQSNNFVLAVGGLVSITEADLDDTRASNVSPGESMVSEDIIRDSLSGSRGIVQITQSAGDMNIIANSLAFSFREIDLR